MRSKEGMPDPGQPDPSIKITYNGRLPRPRRRMFRMLPYGAVPGYSPICCDSNDPQTIIDGLVKRMGRTMPVPDDVFLDAFSRYVDAWLATHLTPLSNIMSFNEWLDSTSYTLARKKELTAVFDATLGMPNRALRRSIGSFGKTEYYLEPKHIRWINSRSDAFKVYSGPAFKSIEQKVFANHHFIKHVPVAERPSLISRLWHPLCRTFQSDYSNFEASFQPKILQACELKLYSYMLSSFPVLSRIICKTIAGVNHGRTRAGVAFTLKGRRMSGDMCTSLGNGFTNLMVWSFLCSLSEAEWDGYVEGDDGIFCVYNGVPPTAEQYTQLGFVVKLEEVEKPQYASFCGIISFDNTSIREPHKFMMGFGFIDSALDCSERTALSRLRAKALSALYETPNDPIVRPMALQALRLTKHVSPIYVHDGYHSTYGNAVPVLSSIDMSTRLFYQTMFGVTVQQQLALEAYAARHDDLNLFSEIMPPPKCVLFNTLRYMMVG